MKKCVRYLLLVFCFGLCARSGAQEQEIQQLLLNVEKLAQLKNILADLKKGYEIVAGGYQTIKNISEGNFALHRQFLDGLLQVSPTVEKYKRVADVMGAQVAVVKEYKQAFRVFKTSGRFLPDELDYIAKVYSRVLDQSLKNLDALAIVITANNLRMSDAERLNAIDGIWNEAESGLTFLRHFNNSTKVLALQRAKAGADIGTTKDLYGVRY